jgi:hypothetical protein
MSVKEGLEIEVTVRSETTQIFNVVAGPFSEFDSANEALDKLRERGFIESQEIEVDPETSLPLNLTFRIYLGEISDIDDYTEISTDYFRSTNRRLSIETDQQAIRLFDQSEFRSWERFIEIFNEVNKNTDLRPLEIFILD